MAKGKKGSTSKIILLLLIGVAVLAAGYQGSHRLAAERQNQTVSMVLDAAQVADVGAREGLSTAEVLKQVSPYVNTLLFKEESLSDLTTTGQLLQLRGSELSYRMKAGEMTGDISGVAAGDMVLICRDQEILSRVQTQIEAKANLTFQMPQLTYADGEQAYVLTTNYPSGDLGTLGVGFSAAKLQQAADAGMGLVLQVRSFGKVTQAGIDTVLDPFADLPLVAVGFNEAEVPGASESADAWVDACKLWAENLSQRQLPLLSIEFYNQKGLSALASKLDYNVIRMHTLPETERAAMTVDRAVQRFQLAATERNMGLVLVRMGPTLGLEGNMAYLTGTKTALEEKGLTLGTPKPLPPLHQSNVILALIALGVAAGGVLLCQVLGLKKSSWVLGGVGFAAILGLLAIGSAGKAVGILSFLAVVIFPTLSVQALVREAPAKNMLAAIGKLVLMSGISLVGALLMVGAMASRDYMTAIHIFAGVKLAHLLPILLLCYLYWFQYSNHGSVKTVVLNTWKTTINVGFAFVVLAVMAVLGLYLLRTGNDNVSISSWERAFRVFLDQVLVVRPRSKEFMFGHPLMLVLLYFGYKKYMGLPLLAMACIGQVSLVNTFAHAHTPLFISGLRTINGLVLGILLGIVLIFAVKAATRLWQGKGVDHGEQRK